MSGTRPAGAEGSNTRTALLDATVQLMLEQGYASVSTRKVAAKAEANPALVYYYFHTMDELFLAVFRRGAEANLRRLEQAAAADNPLRALWEVASEPHDVALTMEFIALANHREAVRTELVAYSRRFRRIENVALASAVRTRGADAGRLSPAALSVLLGGLSRILAIDGVLGITDGHDEVLALVEEYLQGFEGFPPVGDHVPPHRPAEPPPA
ncbi:TetR/AcrR family transcriptional regulator [Streptomyces sp. NPDC048291]|uniref:TetR/AcrR family transcriptional regulator n=1 Tax=Streptomyces sp. NPDC048291 TaxID=3365530 RepID=UPI003715DDA8